MYQESMSNQDTIYPDAPEDALKEYSQGSGDWDRLRDIVDELEDKHGEDVIVDHRIEVFRDE